jgi:phosphohistidine phosphatase SixA
MQQSQRERLFYLSVRSCSATESHPPLSSILYRYLIEERMMKFRIVFTSIVLLIFSLSCFAADQDMIFIVRHAEKASSAPDALLSAVGHQRANCLAHTLKDANVQVIFTPEVKRTQQTAEPLANARHISITVVPRKNQSELLEKARAAARNGAVLIVAQQDTMAQIVQQLGGGTVSAIGDTEFDRLIILHLNPSGSSATTLRYCDCGVSGRPTPSMKQGLAPAAATAPH